MANAVFQGDMDPEIATLLGTTATQAKGGEGIPDYNSLFNDEKSDDDSAGETGEQGTQSSGFPEITKKLEETPHAFFDDPNYYKTALSGEGELAQRFHAMLQKYLAIKDPKDKGVIRPQIIRSYWEFLLSVARKAPGKLSEPKKFLLRFGLLHPNFLTADLRTLFAQIVVENTVDQPIYYLDEWFKAVGTGVVRNSTTDEAQVPKGGGGGNNVKLQQLLEKAKGKQDGAKVLLKAKSDELQGFEVSLKERIAQITEHYPVTMLPEITSCYSDSQKRLFAEVQELLKTLVKTDHDLDMFLKDYIQADEDVKTLMSKVEEDGGSAEVDVKAVDIEFETIRQMVKMTIGRQGNHFPLLTSEYFHCMPNDIAYRENIVTVLSWIESIDAEVYCRVYKNRLNRIVPYVILIPSYGDTGMCWEPFDRFNRATSRGRIAVPMYPKNLQIAVLSAVGDLRWQVAKEKASFYWMEEGITGNYYQWFQKMKLKGDLKDAFIQDYILWMTKESEGTMKLDKELRGIFWRHLPFTQAVKEKLKGRSYIYQELYQRDINRTMSDGY